MSDLPDHQPTKNSERGIVYTVNGDACVGVLHAGSEGASTGVLFVVGGRQYRVGAHRQFVLLARSLADAGLPVFRFDMCGMGDSDGDPQHYLETSTDLESALATFRTHLPSLKNVVVWGLCDGATGAIYTLASLADVSGVMMINPWVTTNSGAAEVRMKHYYRYRLFSSGFWGKLLRGKIDIVSSVRSLLSAIKLVFFTSSKNIPFATELPKQVFDAIEKFEGSISIVISNKDLTALEFYEKYNERYGNSCVQPAHVTITRVDADHTFSGEGQHAVLTDITLQFCLQSPN